MEKIFAYIDEHFDRFVEEFADCVRIPSVSAQGKGLQECAEHLSGKLKALGLHSEILGMGGPENPPLVYGRWDAPASKHTLFTYHHLDVQPADPFEDWDTPPFEPVIKNGRMYARGTADNKGQLLGLVNALEALQKAGGGIPISLRTMFDPQEEMGSPMMESFCLAHRDLFRADFGFGTDGPMRKGDQPVVTFGNRGSCYIEVRVKVSARDTHSGQYGGPMPNGAWRLVEFLETLRDETGRVTVEGFYDDVAPPSDADRTAMDAIPLDLDAWREEMGVAEIAGPRELSFFEKIMFQPTMNICGLKSGYQGPGTKTVIPCEASCKIDMRLVKNQTPDKIYELIIAHAKKNGFDDLEITKNSFQYWPSKTPVDIPMSKAVVASIKEVYGKDPLIIPVSGGSNPAYIFTDLLHIPMCKVPCGNYDETNHAPNENLSLQHFKWGIKLWAKVLTEVAQL